MVIAELFATLGLKSDEHEWNHGHELIDGLKHGLEALAAIEVGKSIAEHLSEMFKGAAEQVETADRLAQSLGTTSDALQELDYAAQMSLVPAEALHTGLQRLALGMANRRRVADVGRDDRRGSKASARVHLADVARRFGTTRRHRDGVQGLRCDGQGARRHGRRARSQALILVGVCGARTIRLDCDDTVSVHTSAC